MIRKKFKGVLGARDSGGWAVEIPFDVKATFGSGRPAVKATVNGVTWHTTLAPYGKSHYLGIRKELRAAAEVEDGDIVDVLLESDDEPRSVDVPHDLKSGLKRSAGAMKTFESLSFSHRREYVEWITSAKKAETRAKRIEKAIVMLEEGKREP